MKDLESSVRQFALRLKDDFANEIACDARGFKKKVLHWLRQELPPRRGRPNDPRLDAAARMIAQGKTTREVLAAQVPGFGRLDTYGRYLAEKGLRAAIGRRRKQKRAAENSPENRSTRAAINRDDNWPAKRRRNSGARATSAPLRTIVSGEAWDGREESTRNLPENRESVSSSNPN